jgi:3-oxoacyl-(acyl-carrier-protein) synthase
MTRIVITGMGVLSANAHGLDDFETALRQGRSGIRFIQKLADHDFACQVAGIPERVDELKAASFPPDALLAMNSNMIHGGIAALECWRDAGLPEPHRDSDVDWDTAALVGTGIGGMDTAGDILIPRTNEKKVRRMGSTIVEQVMNSAPSAFIGGLLGVGGQVTTNSSACTTGTEAIAMAYFLVKEGHSRRVLAGGTEGSSHYSWAGFDAMRVLARGLNDRPSEASRPMSASAAGFVPSSGAGFLMIESLESAQRRGARIYAEILGAHINCGGQRGGGSITFPNPAGVIRCICESMRLARIDPREVDLINGHLTATIADPAEIENWREALGLPPQDFPLIQSTKSLIGHALGAAGGIECVACVLQLARGFVHGSVNCEDLHPKIEPFAASVVHKTLARDVRIVAKASFGFGDVNGCVIFKKWEG